MPASASIGSRSSIGIASRVGPPNGSAPGPMFQTPAPRPLMPTLFLRVNRCDMGIFCERGLCRNFARIASNLNAPAHCIDKRKQTRKLLELHVTSADGFRARQVTIVNLEHQ